MGPLVASALLGLGWPLRHVFAVAVIPALLSVASVLVVREPAPERTPPRAAERTHPAAARLPSPLRRYLSVLARFSLGNSSDAFLLLRAADLGVPVASIPLLWAVFHDAKAVSSHLGGGWSDRVGRAKLIVVGWGVYAATYMAFGFANQPWHAWALFIIYGCHYGLTEPAERALVRELAPLHVRGRAYGVYNFVIGVMAVPAGVLTGWLWQAFSPLVALSAGAALAALASGCLALWARGNTPTKA